MRRAGPRPLAHAVGRVRERLEPATPLATIQRGWPEAVGPAVAREARPVSERAGVVTVACAAAVWAQERDLMAGDLVEALNRAACGPLVRSLRCVATGVP